MSTSRAEITGKTVEAAISEAEQQFGKSRDELEIQVLSQGSRGVFGIGGEPARIIARDPSAPVEEAPPPPAPAPRPERPRREPRPRPERAPTAAPRTEAPARTAVAEEEGWPQAAAGEKPAPDPNEVASAGRDIVERILTKMGFEVEVTVRSTEEPITLDVVGDDLGILIGRRGDSLASLQFMVNVMLSKQFHHWPHLVVDVQGYRSRREQSLNSLGLRVADRVRRNRRPFTLEAMPANDRRIIHLALRDRSDVETYSIGDGATRRVVIAPKR